MKIDGLLNQSLLKNRYTIYSFFLLFTNRLSRLSYGAPIHFS
jgi:hypothetical protein